MTLQKPAADGVAVLVFPFAAGNVFPIARKLMVVMSELVDRPVLVSGGIPRSLLWPETVELQDIRLRMHYVKDRKPIWFSTSLWILKLILIQVRFGVQVFRMRHRIHAVICFFGCYYQVPILVARLLKKKVLTAVTGIDEYSARIEYGSSISPFVNILARFNFHLSHRLIIESLQLANRPALARYRDKLRNGALYLEDDLFHRERIAVHARQNIIGFIGSFRAAKGLLELIEAIPLTLEMLPELQFLLIGSGRLERVVHERVERSSYASRIACPGWVEHEHIPEYLNQMKLLVIPSLEEGLPNIALEALGCGTPVLATHAGGLADLIEHRVTGFYLSDLTPETIAQAIANAIHDPEIEAIACRGRQLIEQHYNLHAARARYAAILAEVVDG